MMSSDTFGPCKAALTCQVELSPFSDWTLLLVALLLPSSFVCKLMEVPPHKVDLRVKKTCNTVM